MHKVINGAEVASHGMFYLEDAGGCDAEPAPVPIGAVADERKPGCFALEDEKGEGWTGVGAMKSLVNEARPTL